MYKIETHLHTTYISKCGWLGAAPLIKYYKEAGYSAICVTDHYNRTCFEYAGIDLEGPGDKIEAFLEGVRRMKEEAADHGIKIYEGAELRFDESENDYLLYGFHHELLADPDAVIKGGLAEFAPKYRADGALMVQAHPYRKKCHPADPQYLDGVEVMNLNPRHANSNGDALSFGLKNNLIMTAGSDCHRPEDIALTGIMSETLPEDSFEFAELLRSGNYTLMI